MSYSIDSDVLIIATIQASNGVTELLKETLSKIISPINYMRAN